MAISVGLGTALAGVGNVIGGLFGRSGQHSANAANLQIARENREWQERMSSTANQRAAKDLQAAGLNRILALGRPSSTPAGNVATMQNVQKPVQEGINAGVSSALQAALLKSQIANVKANTRQTEAQTDAIRPASTIGRGLEEAELNILPEIRDKASRLIDEVDYKSVFNTTADMAKKNIDRISESLGLNPFRARRELIKTVNEMDLPPMTDYEKYRWALRNPEKIKEFLERKKARGF